jgi:hypothetical protein
MIRTSTLSATLILIGLLAACSGNKSGDDDDGGESGESGAGTGGSSGGSGGASGGTGGTATGGTDAAGGTGGSTGGTDATGGTAGTDAAGGTAGTDATGGTDAAGGTAGTTATGGTAGTDATGGTAGTTATGGSAGTGPSDAAPVIVTFATNVTKLDPTQSVTFTAVVTDADGIDNVIGGTLGAEGGSPTYGAFATAASEGSYSLTLTWDQIQQATPLEDDSTEGKLTFEAKFFDAEAHSVTATVELTLLCDEPGGDFVCCGGESVNLQDNDDHCGMCGNACEYSCYEGECSI